MIREVGILDRCTEGGIGKVQRRGRDTGQVQRRRDLEGTVTPVRIVTKSTYRKIA